MNLLTSCRYIVRALAVLCIGLVSVASAEPVFDETVVVASKLGQPLWRVAAQVTSYNAEDLSWLQARGLGDVARYHPALEVDDSGARFGSTGMSLRGIGGNRVVIALDGVSMPQHFRVGEFASASRNALDTAAIGKIEVLRGPASSIYGSDAIGGVIAVSSIEPAQLVSGNSRKYLGGETSHDSANDSTHGYMTMALLGKSQAGLLSLGRHAGRETPSAVPGARTDEVDFTQSRAFAKWQIEPGNYLLVKAIADWYRREQDSNLLSPLGVGRQYSRTIDLRGQDDQERRRVSVSASLLEPGLLDSATLQVFQQDNRIEQHTRDIRNLVADGAPSQQIDRVFGFEERLVGVDFLGSRTFETRHSMQTLVAGFALDQTRLIEYRDGVSRDLATGATTKVLPPGELLPRRDLPKSRVTSSAVFLQHEISIGDTTLVPSVRWDRFSLKASLDELIDDASRLTSLEDDDLSFRLGVTHRLGSATAVYFQYAQGFRAPPAEDVNLYLDYQGSISVRAIPNPDLSSERSTNLEAGLRYSRLESRLELAAYHSSYRRLIESRVRVGFDPVDGSLIFQSRNVQRARIVGIEASASQGLGMVHPALSPFGFSLALHVARGENTDTGQPLNFLEPMKAVAALLWNERGAVSLGLYATAVARQQRVDTATGVFYVPPGSTAFDLLGRWSVNDRLSLNFAVSNLNDKVYWRYGKVRAFVEGDPRIDALAEPGRHFSITAHFSVW